MRHRYVVCGLGAFETVAAPREDAAGGGGSVAYEFTDMGPPRATPAMIPRNATWMLLLAGVALLALAVRARLRLRRTRPRARPAA